MRCRGLRLLPGVVMLLLAVAAPLRAGEDIKVRSAHVELQGGMLHVALRGHFPEDEQMRSALAAGATVDFDLQVALDRINRYWIDERVLEARLRRELAWNSPTRRYVLRDLTADLEVERQRTFATLEEALDAAGAVDDWVVDLEEPLDPAASYRVGVRARMRRGRVPSALRALTFWTRYWSRSEWYTWPLPR